MGLLHTVRAGALLAISIVVALPNQPVFGLEPPKNGAPIGSGSLAAGADERVDHDLAKLLARARMVYISSGTIAFSGRAIDNNVQTAFRFSGSDLHPTVIVELAGSAPVGRVSAVFDAQQSAKVDVYLLNDLPRNPVDLGSAKPLTCVVDRADVSRAAVNFAPTNARYVAWRWTRQRPSKTPFVVAELGAFSHVSAEQIPPALAEAEVHFFGESGSDLSNNLGTLAVPPVVGVVSP